MKRPCWSRRPVATRLGPALVAALLTLFVGNLGVSFAHGLTVTVHDAHISVPDTVESGYTEFVLANESQSIYAHEIVKIKAGADAAAFRDGIIAFFTGKADEKTVGTLLETLEVFAGGAVGTLPGTSRSVGMMLTPVTYVIYADRISDQGPTIDQAHTAIIKVTQAARPVPAPEPDFTIKLGEYAFMLPTTIEPGTHLVAFENVGKEDHLGFVFRLPDGVSAEEAMHMKDPVIDWARAQGLHALGSGATAYAQMTFEPGATYLFDCPIPNDAGKAHDELGMMRFVEIPQARSGTPLP